jgi:Fic family protein
MTTYLYQLNEWPNFTWDAERIAALLASVRHQQGRLIGRMESLGFSLRSEAILETLTTDVIKSSEIEEERLDYQRVRSSVARRLGMDIGALPHQDRHVEGIVEMMLDATQNYASPLTDKRLFAWHAALFPTGYSGIHKISVGKWRPANADPMQVVSGPYGKERVHYEAPAAKQLNAEMKPFLKWFNSENTIDPVLKAAIAHLWFVSIHPFEDGNGRIARAIADMALARSENSPQRFYSMSAQIRIERDDYYDMLEAIQKASLDITAWIAWFLSCLGRAFTGTEKTLRAVLIKKAFWEAHAAASLNDRQRLMLNRLLDGFEGKLTSSKWAKIAKCSQDTAKRDIDALIEQGILLQSPEGGRSTSYYLVATSENTK